MIKTFADKRTHELYMTGNAKRFPPDVANRAIRKLEYVDLATSLNDLKVPSATDCIVWKAIARASTQSPLTTSGESASGSKMGMHTMSKYAITTEMENEMSISNRGQRQRRPTHPGEMLREDFLPDYQLTASGLARAIGVSRQSINELLRGRRAVSPEMALRLGKLFGNSPEFWLKAQRAVDLWDAEQTHRAAVANIKTLNVA